MDEGDLIRLGLLLVAVLFSAFFSSSEAAFLSLQRARITDLVNTGVPGAARVARMAPRAASICRALRLYPAVMARRAGVSVKGRGGVQCAGFSAACNSGSGSG